MDNMPWLNVFDHEDYGLYCITDENIRKSRKHVKNSLIFSISSLLRFLQRKENLLASISNQDVSKSQEEVDVELEEELESTWLNGMEDFMERLERTMDEILAKNILLEDKKLNSVRPSESTMTVSPVIKKWIKGKKLDYQLIHAQNIMRPQIRFEDLIDNHSTVFLPKIKEKPNALISLDESLLGKKEEEFMMDDNMRSHMNTLGLSQAYEVVRNYPHPYAYEIMHLVYSEEFLIPRQECIYIPLNNAPCVWIDTLEKLSDMANILTRQTEFAIDLEQHNYRSFQGFVCLMQISTREGDYLVDTLTLRSSLYLLNTSFSDPKIVKVLHGADSDIVWLQRDFGLYLVNMFDTGQAARVLNYPSFSLAYLLDFFCQVTADKRYQLADWRIRPLPEEMYSYAREDTHYLLYIYDRLWNELITKSHDKRNLLQAVFERSRELTLRVYEKELFTPHSYLKLYQKYNKILMADQLAVFRAAYEWRDIIAREEDESVRYVLPNHMLFKLAENMPTNSNGVLDCCHPVPPFVRLHSTDLAMLISREKFNSDPENVDRANNIPTSKLIEIHDQLKKKHLIQDVESFEVQKELKLDVMNSAPLTSSYSNLFNLSSTTSNVDCSKIEKIEPLASKPKTVNLGQHQTVSVLFGNFEESVQHDGIMDKLKQVANNGYQKLYNRLMPSKFKEVETAQEKKSLATLKDKPSLPVAQDGSATKNSSIPSFSTIIIPDDEDEDSVFNAKLIMKEKPGNKRKEIMPIDSKNQKAPQIVPENIRPLNLEEAVNQLNHQVSREKKRKLIESKFDQKKPSEPKFDRRSVSTSKSAFQPLSGNKSISFTKNKK